MRKERQIDIIKMEITEALDKGETDKKIIWDIVEANTGFPRPSIRRVSRDLVKDFEHKVKVLSASWKRPGK